MLVELFDQSQATTCGIGRQIWSERELVELTAAIAWENYRARFNRVFRIEAVGYSEGAVCALPVRLGHADDIIPASPDGA